MNIFCKYGFALLSFFLLGLNSRAQSLQLTSPNGGEVWAGGSTRNITWTYTNVDNIKIEYSLNNGLTWTVISASTPTSALSYAWVVPAIGSTQAKVRITNTLQFTQDESNNVFTIPQGVVDVVYPSGGESFAAGTGQYIEWTSYSIANLKFQYTANNGTSWTDIGIFPAADGYCNWVSPATVNSQTRIRAFNIENSIDRDSSGLLSITALDTGTPDKFKGGSGDGFSLNSTLPDTIALTSPNGSENLYPASTYTISWTYNDVDNIKIEYSTNNGSSWTQLVTDIPASQLSYVWTIPNTPSSQCLVKVSSTTRSISDVSNAVFTIIAPTVTLLYPNGGESFGASTGQYIEWNYSSISTVKLEYSTNNGTSWSTIGTSPAVDKYANWIPPAMVGTQYLIRVSDNSDANVNDVSDVNFSIVSLPSENTNKFKGGSNDGYSISNSLADTLKVTSPNGGEQWAAASIKTITWTYNDVDNISLEYSLDDGQTWTTIVANIPASQLSYSWTLPTTPSYTCRVRIKDITRNISDQNDNVFIIPTSYVQITYPNGGESFGAGTGQYIEWDYADIGTLKLEYSTNNGSTWNVIGTSPAADKYANWVVPATVSTQLLIRATDANNPVYTDVSNLAFSSFALPTENTNKFKGGAEDGYSYYVFRDEYVKVISPNGNEVWGNGTTQQIKWLTLNNSENLKIEYSADNEATWTTLANNVANTPNSYNWTLAAPVSSTAKVRISTVTNGLFDKSDDFFTIANPNGIITNSLSGSNFCSNQTTTVDFSINGVTFNPGNNFIVQLSDSVGTFNGSLINIGQVAATSPQSISVQFPLRYYTSSLYRLRVIGTDPPTIGTDNGSNFTISPLPKVNLGNDTILCSGTTITLNATNTGSTYLWSTGATTPTLSVNQSGSYHVTVTNSCGITRDTIVIQGKQLPVVNLGNDTAICINSAITLNAGNTNSTYLWSTGATSQQINAVVTGNYSVTVTNVCGSSSDIIAISNKPAASVNLGNDRGICSGETVTLDAGNPGSTYIWSTGGNTQSIAVTSPGTYSVNVNTVCGVVSDQITLYNGTFTVNAGADKNICTGQSATLNATGANNYTWNSGQTTSAITVSPTVTTSYTVTATNIYNCTSSDAVVVNVNPLPAASITAGGPSTFCQGDSVLLNANTGTGLTYQWKKDGSNIGGATASSYTANAAGSYEVVVTNTNNCSATSSAIAVMVNALPSASITVGGPSTFCQGDSVLLNANTGTGLTYQWKKDGSNISGATASSYTANAAGSYEVVVTNASNCSATSSASAVSVNASITPTFTQAGPYVSGANIPALPTTSNNGINGSWSPAINNTATTTYTFTAAAGQCASTASMNIVIEQPLNYTLTTSKDTVCPGETVTLSVNIIGTYRAGTVHCNGTPTAVVEVTNPVTGKTWMDRNLGATQVATSSTDANAYGDLYQWGRGADGHQCRNSATTSTLSSSDNPGHGDFITLADSWSGDWFNPDNTDLWFNTNLWQGLNGLNNPCPNGYRIPTETELNNERLSWTQTPINSSNNYIGAFASPIKLTLAGVRGGYDGLLWFVQEYGSYWTSTIDSNSSLILEIFNNDARINGPSRGTGMSVRCIKD
jgi:hypothetical protein